MEKEPKSNRKNNTYTARVVEEISGDKIDINDYIRKLIVRKLQNK